MAILIPSKNIYEKQNPKVSDNVIERIEVGAVEVVPNNEYETPVYNESITSVSYTTKESHNSTYKKYTYDEEDSAAEYEDYIGIYAGITAKYTNIDISIPKLSNNKLISNLLLKKDNESKIGINLICEVRHYSVTADYDTATNTISNIQKTENEEKRETKNIVNIQEIFSKQNGEKGYLYFSKSEKKYGVSGGTVSIETNIKDNNNILTIGYTDENDSYEIKGLNILSGATGLGLSGHSGDYDYILLTGDEVDYTPIQVEITIYGNKIGIDLTDKTVYIPETDKTSKKVHSVDGNELMQTSNYYQSTDTNAITRAFTETQTDYAKGNETATIRCSISDYYDFNSGDKVLSIDNSTGKMSFKMYDRVIPMVYGADGKDRPMSSYQDGKGKVFQVLGSKIYYDGAVWQELSLQETYNSYYAINFSQAHGMGNERFTGYRFEIQGVGKILINGVVAQEVNSTNESQVIEISNKNGEYPSTADIEFVGCFSRIATTALSSTSAGTKAGTLNKIISYDNSQSGTYPYMFYYQSVGEKNVYFPSFIDIIAPYTFYYATSSVGTLGLLTIPKHIKKIGERAFSMSSIPSIKFLHDPEAHIFLPTAGSETGMFYDKSARNITIYTDNEMIKNYDWATDNITPTFYHLDGTVWE